MLFGNMRREFRRTLLVEEIDFAAKYENDIRAIGDVEFVATMFLAEEDSELTNLLLRLTCIWKNFPFDVWRQVLRQIAARQPALYQFTWFASGMLAIDVGEMIRSDPAIDAAVYRQFEFTFREGVPQPEDWTREILEREGVDCEGMRRRLAAEGAPMNAGWAPQ